MTKNYLRYLIAAAFAAASHVALAITEMEPNDSIALAKEKPFVFSSDWKLEVNGILGITTKFGTSISDTDFHSFQGRAGQKVTIDIDNGMKLFGRSVDTYVAIFRPNGKILMAIDNAPSLDEGSISVDGFIGDSYLDEVLLPEDGIYTVGVTGFPRMFGDGGVLTQTGLNNWSNGAYTMFITATTPPPTVQLINIEIKPGIDSLKPPLNRKAKGNIPVALISSAEFDALKVDRSSLTFGPTGDEASLLRCGKDGEYVDDDNLLDLVCHFDNQAAGFEPGDEYGIVKGKVAPNAEAMAKGMTAPRPFRGRSWLKIIPVKREN